MTRSHHYCPRGKLPLFVFTPGLITLLALDTTFDDLLHYSRKNANDRLDDFYCIITLLVHSYASTFMIYINRSHSKTQARGKNDCTEVPTVPQTEASSDYVIANCSK